MLRLRIVEILQIPARALPIAACPSGQSYRPAREARAITPEPPARPFASLRSTSLRTGLRKSMFADGGRDEPQIRPWLRAPA